MPRGSARASPPNALLIGDTRLQARRPRLYPRREHEDRKVNLADAARGIEHRLKLPRVQGRRGSRVKPVISVFSKSPSLSMSIGCFGRKTPSIVGADGNPRMPQ